MAMADASQISLHSGVRLVRHPDGSGFQLNMLTTDGKHVAVAVSPGDAKALATFLTAADPYTQADIEAAQANQIELKP